MGGGRKKIKHPALLRAAAVLIALLVVFVMVDWRLGPVVETIAENQALASSLRIINNAVMEELDRQGVDYDELIIVTQSSSGQVTSIQTDMLAINQLKTRILSTILEELDKEENRVVEVPVGTLLGIQFASGRGPRVEISVVPTGYAESGTYNEFISAGINQTLHRIMLTINVEVIVILAGINVKTNAEASVCIAETVIVGQIPDGYTVVEGDNRTTIPKINDYSAYNRQ